MKLNLEFIFRFLSFNSKFDKLCLHIKGITLQVLINHCLYTYSIIILLLFHIPLIPFMKNIFALQKNENK